MSNLYQETINIMKKYKIYATKSLGQNFLIDENVVNAIVEAANITKEDLVIEVGPGLGTLTKELLEKAGKVICVELDSKMLQVLQERFSSYTNLELIHEDILKLDLTSLIEKQPITGNVKVVANLPYYITTPIITKLLEDKLPIESITVMIQKEVAKRLTAVPGDKNTGAISYCVYYYAQSQEILEVPNNSFIPEPEVTSEVIKLSIRKEPVIKVTNQEKLFQVVKVAFMQRRKTILNSLSNGGIVEKQKCEQILKDLAINEKARAEELTIEQLGAIAEKI